MTSVGPSVLAATGAVDFASVPDLDRPPPAPPPAPADAVVVDGVGGSTAGPLTSSGAAVKPTAGCCVLPVCGAHSSGWSSAVGVSVALGLGAICGGRALPLLLHTHGVRGGHSCKPPVVLIPTPDPLPGTPSREGLRPLPLQTLRRSSRGHLRARRGKPAHPMLLVPFRDGTFPPCYAHRPPLVVEDRPAVFPLSAVPPSAPYAPFGDSRAVAGSGIRFHIARPAKSLGAHGYRMRRII